MFGSSNPLIIRCFPLCQGVILRGRMTPEFFSRDSVKIFTSGPFRIPIMLNGDSNRVIRCREWIGNCLPVEIRSENPILLLASFVSN